MNRTLPPMVCRICLTLSVLGFLESANPLLAEDQDPLKLAWERKTGALKFNKVLMGDVTETLSNEYPEFNFVMNEAAAEIPVTLRLQSVDLADILTALELSSSGRLRCRRAESGLVSILGNPPKREVSTLKAFNLKPYLEGRKGKDAAAALRQLEDVLQRSWAMLEAANEESGEEMVMNFWSATLNFSANSSPTRTVRSTLDADHRGYSESKGFRSR